MGLGKKLLNPSKEPKTIYDLCWYESPILDKFLNENEGWKIKDWKMCKSKNGTDWTFILEKEDEITAPIGSDEYFINSVVI